MSRGEGRVLDAFLFLADKRSVGLEDSGDLIADLDAALTASASQRLLPDTPLPS